jgi:hypothetical protein
MKKTVFILLAAAATATAADVKLPSGRTYKAEPADFRVVDGKVYNIVLSTNWVKLPQGDANMRVHNVISNGVYFRIEGKRSNPDTFVFVKNYPDRDKLTTDQRIEKVVAMQTGIKNATNKAGGEYTMKAYDHGLPNTPDNRNGVASVKP